MTVRDTPITTNPEDERAYARIEQALASLGEEHSPPPGWEEQVLAAVDEEEKRRATAGQQPGFIDWLRRLRWAAPAMGAVAVAVVVLVLWRGPEQTEPGGGHVIGMVASAEPLTLTMNEKEPDPKDPYRGTTACSFHKFYLFDASASGAHRQLRIYRDSELSAVCGTDVSNQPDSPLSCELSPNKLHASWKPPLPGPYAIVIASSSRELPPAGVSLDTDMASLNLAKVEHVQKNVSCY